MEYTSAIEANVGQSCALVYGLQGSSMNSQKPLKIQKPKSIWTRSVKFDLKPLFKSLAKTATHAATLKLEELGTDAVEVATSIGLDTPVEEVAYALIRQATFGALVALTKEILSHADPASMNSDGLSAALESSLDNTLISLGEDFFKSPEDAPHILKVAGDYSQWLCDHGVSPRNADTISKRLPSYYVFALAEEWRRAPQLYARLLDEATTPFAKAESELKGWGYYFAYLKRRLAENVFDEPFSLEQIYIPLNAYYVQRIEKAPGEFRTQDRKVCVRLHEELRNWLSQNKIDDRIKVISGGPGSGKSSFARVFCSEMAESGIARPLYIPLHLIDPTRDISAEVERFVRDEGFLGFNPLESERKEDKLLLVFDGLDELASMGKASAQVARDFVQAVERMVERRNIGREPIRVLLSGRELVVQENQTEFRGNRQILNLLPYYLVDNKDAYVDDAGVIAVDLRQEWWRNYGRLTGELFAGLPEQLRLKEIDEITSQPLLNYLVALSYRRGELDFSKRLNLNNIYQDLVTAVYQRGYERSRTYRPIKHITLQEFIRVLEEIGLAAWHGSDGRSTSVRDILLHCQQSGLEALLKSFTEGAEAGVTKLLAAFFFRRSNESAGEDATFVFTHKSFGEYLTAVRLYRALDKVVAERERRKVSLDDGLDVNEAWLLWLRLAGPAPMTEYIQTFLRREIAERPTAVLERWQAVLAELCVAAMDDTVPIERLGSISFSKATRHFTNASTAILIALNCVSTALGRMARIKFRSEESFGTFLRRVCPQRVGPKSPVLFTALSYLDLSRQCLDMVDLYGADLRNTKWSRAQLHFANLSTANLADADFSDAILNWARLDGASLVNTIFRGAHLQDSNLGSTRGWKTSLKGVDFEWADLSGADFDGDDIDGCNFKNSLLASSSLNRSRSIGACAIEGATVSSNEKALLRWISNRGASGEVVGTVRILKHGVKERESGIHMPRNEMVRSEWLKMKREFIPGVASEQDGTAA